MVFLARFLQKTGVFLFFIFLQVLSLFLYQKHDDLSHTKIGITILNISGWFGEKSNFAQRFFTLHKENEKLAIANAELQKRLTRLTNLDTNHDPVSRIDSTTREIYQYNFLPVRVVNNSLSKKDNYITINRGENDSLRKGMGVITDFGLVGKIERVSKKYALVQSLLHSKSKTTAQIKGNSTFGTMIWNGEDPDFMTLVDVSKFIPAKKEDTIETYGGRSIFPRYHPIGTVDTVVYNPISGTNNIKIKLFQRFESLQMVHVVKNIDVKEIKELESKGNIE